MFQNSQNCSPPWQVIDLVATHLDPKTLAKSSCVSKTWYISMSSNHLWKDICNKYFPSLTKLAGDKSSAMTYRSLYALSHVSAIRRRYPLPKPRLTLENLVFAIDVYVSASPVVSLAKPGGELDVGLNGLFEFDVDVFCDDLFVFEEFDEIRVVWNVVLDGFGGIFNMMNCKGKGRDGMSGGGWFSERLPSPACCFSGGGSGIAAELRLGFSERSEGKVVIEKVSVGVMSEVSWRYVLVDDVLRYLQHFLLPIGSI